MRILVVDDDDPLRTIISEILQSEGHVTEEASDGLHAIARIDATAYDIVITDIVMPGLNGAAVAAHIKNGQLPTSVLLISGYPPGEDGNILGFASYFGDEFLEKPFYPDELLTAVNNLKTRPSTLRQPESIP